MSDNQVQIKQNLREYAEDLEQRLIEAGIEKGETFEVVVPQYPHYPYNPMPSWAYVDILGEEVPGIEIEYYDDDGNWVTEKTTGINRYAIRSCDGFHLDGCLTAPKMGVQKAAPIEYLKKFIQEAETLLAC